MNTLRSVALCLYFSLFFSNLALALDPNRLLSQYAHSSWLAGNGILEGIPRVFAQTGNGYIWIGTTDGLMRFDGVKFVRWEPPSGEQLPSLRINSLLVASDGSLWIGTAAGLSHWQNNHLSNYSNVRGVVPTIVQARDGTIWFSLADPAATVGRLCEVVATGIKCHGKDEGIPEEVYDSMVQDTDGNFWLGGRTDLVRWKLGVGSTYKLPALRSKLDEGVRAMVVGSDGSLWLGMSGTGRGLGLMHFARGLWEPFVNSEFDRTADVIGLLLDRENALWVATMEHGIYRIYEGKAEHFGSTEGLSSDHVIKVFEDHEGNVWVSTSKGIDNFRDLRVASFSTREGLKGDEVDSVLGLRDGSVLAGGPGFLRVIRLGRVSSLAGDKSLSTVQVTSLLQDHAGRLWVGLDSDLSVYQHGKFHRIYRRNGSSAGMIIGMTEDKDNNIWVEAKGRSMTLIRVDGLEVKEEFPSPPMPSARKVAADPNGGLWLGLVNGDLARYQNGTIKTFRFSHSQDSRVEQLAITSDGSVLGATEFGLIGWKQGKQLILTSKNGLPCTGVFAFISDERDNLWLYTPCGLLEITNSDFQNLWEHADAVIRPTVFDVLDGAQPGRAPFVQAARSSDGRLWFTNGVLLQMIDPNHLNENRIAPPVDIQGISAGGRTYSPQNGLVFPPLQKDLEFEYTALSFVAPQKVRFRYKLEGHDTQWQEPGARRQAFYNDLPPGKYRFRVIACNNDGLWNEKGAVLDFSIAPAWYQTSSFLFFCVGTAILLAWALYRLRIRQIVRTINARFDERLAERTRLARELHDTFLQTIQGSKLVVDDALKKSGDHDRMQRAVEQVSVWLDRAVHEGRDALNSLRTSTTQSNDLAEALRRATEECRMQSSIDVSFLVVGNPGEMHPVVRDEVYRIGYEAIRNACAHSAGGRLEVRLEYTQDLTLCVSDNGRGIDPEILSKGKDSHFGLRGMQERAARIRSIIDIRSSTDSGTRITLTVPGRIAFTSDKLLRPSFFHIVKNFLGKPK